MLLLVSASLKVSQIVTFWSNWKTWFVFMLKGIDSLSAKFTEHFTHDIKFLWKEVLYLTHVCILKLKSVCNYFKPFQAYADIILWHCIVIRFWRVAVPKPKHCYAPPAQNDSQPSLIHITLCLRHLKWLVAQNLNFLFLFQFHFWWGIFRIIQYIVITVVGTYSNMAD